MKAPVILFPEYKWRWATGTPTEGLNYPPVFLGVLRALYKHNGEAPSSEGLIHSLAQVEAETKTAVDLARTAERNLIRNSGQYWKALRVLAPGKGVIQVTDLGAKLANGVITKLEFAATIVRTLELPNRLIEPEVVVKAWDTHGLKIKPLQLILEILNSLQEGYGPDNAWITPHELTRIVIPLAGNKATKDKYVEAIIAFRNDKLDLASWPNCTPEGNDQRMAREFLLFLSYYGFCKLAPSALHANEKYFLAFQDSQDFAEFAAPIEKVGGAGPEIAKTAFTTATERQRVLTEILSRPQQAAFRSKVLKASDSTCIVTGVKFPSVLEAAHIVPVSENGVDEVHNGLCMRADIHLLYDSGYLRIDPEGMIYLSETAAKSYPNLPKMIDIPEFISKEFMAWRWKYE